MLPLYFLPVLKPLLLSCSGSVLTLEPPMLDPKLLRKKPGWVAEQLQRRGYALDLGQFETLERERREADASLQELQAERRRIARQVDELRRQDVPVEEAKQQVGERLARVDTEMDALKQRQARAHETLQEFLALVPNLPDAGAPQGLSAAQNMECSRWGEAPEFSFTVRDHVDLCGAQKLDFEAASRLAGARFNVLYDELAQLHRALGQCMLDLHVEQHGYREAYVPYIASGETLWGVGQLPKFAEDIFRLDEERDFYLIPTAEVPLSNLFRERIFNAEYSTSRVWKDIIPPISTNIARLYSIRTLDFLENRGRLRSNSHRAS